MTSALTNELDRYPRREDTVDVELELQFQPPEKETARALLITSSRASSPEVTEIPSNLENGPEILAKFQRKTSQTKPKPSSREVQDAMKELASKQYGLIPS